MPCRAPAAGPGWLRGDAVGTARLGSRTAVGSEGPRGCGYEISAAGAAAFPAEPDPLRDGMSQF